jgi:hypothetical protein
MAKFPGGWLQTPSLGDVIIALANNGYHNQEKTGYPPFALAPWDDRIRWSNYIKKIADEIEAEQAKTTVPTVGPWELEQILKDDVAAAGGPKKWRKKHRVHVMSAPDHLLENGQAANLATILHRMGYRRVERFAKI